MTRNAIDWNSGQNRLQADEVDQLVGIRSQMGHSSRTGRGGRIRTADFLDPNQTRYQTALRPDGKKGAAFNEPAISRVKSYSRDRRESISRA